MSIYRTSINLLAASEADVKKLHEAMGKKNFYSTDLRSAKDQAEHGPIVYSSSSKSNFIEASTDVSTAASSVGRKFSFTIMKDK
jgi:hypothetical protein